MFRALLAAAVVTIAASVPSGPAKASLFQVQFEIDYVLGIRQDLLGGLITGTLEATDIGNLVIDANGGTTTLPGALVNLDLDFNGQAFASTDDADYPAYPEVFFLDYTPVYVDAQFVESSSLQIDEPYVTQIDIPTVIDCDLNTYECTGYAEIVSAEVPLPAGLPLLATGMLAFGLIKRQRNAAA